MRKDTHHHRSRTLLVVLFLLVSFANSTYSQDLKIHTIHVHGDAHVIQTPGGKTMLLDAGSPWHVNRIKKFIDSLGIARIDVALLTHFHGDHYGGFAGEEGILATYPVSEFYGVEPGPSIRIFQQHIQPYSKNSQIKYQVIKKGDFIDLDPELEIEVLYPPDSYPETDGNNGSAACMITDVRNGRKFLYMGDGMEKQARDLVDLYHEALRCDVLKYGHHLQYAHDDDFSTGTFLEITQPKFGIITKHKMSKPGPVYHDLTIHSLRKLYNYTWGGETGLKSFHLAKHGHITVTCAEDGEITMSASKGNLYIPPKIVATEKTGLKEGTVTLKLALSKPTWDHYVEEIRGCYSFDGGQTWNAFFYPDKQLEITETTTVMYEARDIYGNRSETKTVKISVPAPIME